MKILLRMFYVAYWKFDFNLNFLLIIPLLVQTVKRQPVKQNENQLDVNKHTMSINIHAIKIP